MKNAINVFYDPDRGHDSRQEFSKSTFRRETRLESLDEHWTLDIEFEMTA